MKILRLRLENLNSLRGETVVDFTAPPLAQVGLFAITGPTGAGKTTLLDAITLALYGRVARYGQMPNPEAIMSRHTGECAAEVEFACASGVFRSSWSLQRARKKAEGKVQPAKRRLVALPAGMIVAESIKEVDAQVPTLTGLDYDRFLRSVLLAQGDFAAFLKAGAKERTELLQEVTGTAIYRDISMAAHRRSAEATQARDRGLAEQGAVSVLTPEERARHEADTAALLDVLRALTTEGERLNARVAAARRSADLAQQAQQWDADHAALVRDQAERAGDLARLDAHERVVPLLADFATADRLAREVAQENARRAALDAQAPERAKAVDTTAAALAAATEALAGEEARVEAARPLWAEVTQLDQALGVARESWRLVSGQHAETRRALGVLQTTRTKDAETLTHLVAGLDRIRAWLRDNAGDAGLATLWPEVQAAGERWQAAERAWTEAQAVWQRFTADEAALAARVLALRASLAPTEAALRLHAEALAVAETQWRAATGGAAWVELDAARGQAQARRTAAQTLVEEAARLRSHAEELAQRRADHALVAGEGLQVTARMHEARRHLAEASEVVTARRTMLGMAEKILSLDGHRAALIDGQPCPLCGAVHHPYSNGGDVGREVSQAKHALSEAETAEKSAHAALTELEKRHAAATAEQARLAEMLAKGEAERASRLDLWTMAMAAAGSALLCDDAAGLADWVRAQETAERACTERVTQARDAEQRRQAAREALHQVQTNATRAQADLATQVALQEQLAARRSGVGTAEAERRADMERGRAQTQAAVQALGRVPERAMDVPELVSALKQRAVAYAGKDDEARALDAQVATRTQALADVDRRLEELASTEQAQAAQVKAAAMDGESRAEQRRQRFGEQKVEEAQRAAEAALRQLRAQVETARAAAERQAEAQRSALEEGRKLAERIAAQLAEASAVAERIQQMATAAGFADAAAARAARLPTAEAEALAAQRRRLHERAAGLAARRTTLDTERAALPAEAAADAVALESLLRAVADNETRRAEANQRVGSVGAILRTDDAQRAKLAGLAAQMEALQREFTRWDRLRALIGSADGSVFARFAQGLTLETLTGLANGHLRQLNPRYSLRRVRGEGEDALELEIVDHYQADTTRPMRSLSGGESFLASLALALGLSELASGRTAIDSLFIDEGFGTLDSETLETAMSALESLQAQGKTVGVISHMPAVQERIAVQIRVTKEAGGCSRVSISG